MPDYAKNEPMQLFYAKLGQLRSSHPVLWAKAGKEPRFKLIETTSPEVLAFERQRDDDRVLVFVNLSNEIKPLNFPDKAPGVKGMRNHFYHFITSIPTELQPWEFQIFRTKPKFKRLRWQSKFGSVVEVWSLLNVPRYLDYFWKNEVEEYNRVKEYNKKIDELEDL